jgi:hypothetical protein
VKFKKIYFADFEAFTRDEQGGNIMHDPFLICYNYYVPELDILSDTYNGKNIHSLINHIINTTFDPEKSFEVLVYFHNLTYDA